MARTAIPVTSISPYQASSALSFVNGDSANDHSIDFNAAPKLILLIYNTGGSTVSYDLVFPASKTTYNAAYTLTSTVDSDDVAAHVLDLPPDMAQSGNVIHLDSADANFGDLRLAAYTWASTQAR